MWKKSKDKLRTQGIDLMTGQDIGVILIKPQVKNKWRLINLLEWRHNIYIVKVPSQVTILIHLQNKNKKTNNKGVNTDCPH